MAAATSEPKGASRSFPKRGELYYVRFDPVVGSEQGGRRPALVVQNDLGNEHSPVVIVAAVTSSVMAKGRRTDVLIDHVQSGLERPSRVMLNQIRTVDKRRVGRFIGSLSATDLEAVDQAIRISLGLENP